MSISHHPNFFNHLPLAAHNERGNNSSGQQNTELGTPEQEMGSVDNKDVKRIHEAKKRWWLLNTDKDVEELNAHKYSYDISLDVSDYKPNEIEVNIDNDSLLVVGRHEEDASTSCVRREFMRRYSLPTDVDRRKVTSALSGGILKIDVPKFEAF